MIRPVLVAIGEVRDRPASIADGLDPIGLMACAARNAEADFGSPILDRIDSVDIVHQISWRYEDTARRVCERLNIAPAMTRYHPGGGDSPVHIVHEAALRIARGESRIVLVCGGEAQNTAKKARSAEIDLPWPERAATMEHPWHMETKLSPMSIAHGVAQPTYIYPLYENATAHGWGLTPAQAEAESAALWARYCEVALSNPFSWQRKPLSAEDIATISPTNPLIAYPYPRLMVANPTVNQGAAVIMMAEAVADELGVPSARRIHFAGGAAAKEPDNFLHRDSYTACPAQQVVLDAARGFAPESGFGALELYSCFPCVPKMARRQLGLDDTVVPTVTGGLTFFGGPYNDYMLHATCAMVRRLRGSADVGLLYGQGDFVTKHHALVLSATPPPAPLVQDYRLDAQADAIRGPLPEIVDRAEGDATLETFTILADRQSRFDRGIAILRLPDGARTMARIPASDETTLRALSDQQQSPIGLQGRVAVAGDDLLEWTIT